MADLNRTQATKELGVSGEHVRTGYQQEEFLPRLRGRRALQKYQEIAENDAIAGAFLTAIDMTLRSVEWEVEAADDSQEAQSEKEFVETVLNDMSHTFEEFMSEVLSMLTFGFSFFETVYKVRQGRDQKDAAKRSQYTDGRIGIRKLAPRSQLTLERFKFDEDGGVAAFVQGSMSGARGGIEIPIEKGLLFRTVSRNSSPSGRSIFRNAYKSYHYLTNIQSIEAIAIERELNGVPIGRIPAEYLQSNADGSQKKIKTELETILRDLKQNEQAYALIPSDTFEDADGNPTNTRMMDIELITSNGTRNIDTGPVIKRYQSDMARTVLADFIMLGSDKGSFALSKSKTDLFLTSLESYLGNIASVLNRHLLPRLWQLNGLNPDLMPRLRPGEVAPTDLDELGNFVKSLAGSGIMLTDLDTENTLRSKADLPMSDGDDEDMLGRPDEG